MLVRSWTYFLSGFWIYEEELPLYAVCTTFAVCKNPLLIYVAHTLTTMQKAYLNATFVFHIFNLLIIGYVLLKKYKATIFKTNSNSINIIFKQNKKLTIWIWCMSLNEPILPREDQRKFSDLTSIVQFKSCIISK